MATADRNNKVQELLEELFSNASDSSKLPVDLKTNVEIVFNTTVWGFREILLVILIARILDKSYEASKSFYKCNPRALYEGPIRSVLLKQGIPHKKSGPLNVAKAAAGINSQWAAQRRPALVASKVVVLVKEIEKLNKKSLYILGQYLAWRFLKEASRVSTLTVKVQPESDPKFLFDLSKALIISVPDGGNSPQKVVGLLLHVYHEDLQTGLKVVGVEDSASVTSTTSKKPGDITEELLDGTIAKVYEITVKPFGSSRVEESYDALNSYYKIAKVKIEEVIVICRKEDKHPELTSSEQDSIYFGKLEYQDVTYHFADIFDWIMSQLLRMSADARLAYYLKLNEHVMNPNTSEKVKLFWQKYHSQD